MVYICSNQLWERQKKSSQLRVSWEASLGMGNDIVLDGWIDFSRPTWEIERERIHEGGSSKVTRNIKIYGGVALGE